MPYSPKLLPMLRAFAAIAQTPRWTESKANAWHTAQPWLAGANYIPTSASYGAQEPANKVDVVYDLPGRTFKWARSVPVSPRLVFHTDGTPYQTGRSRLIRRMLTRK